MMLSGWARHPVVECRLERLRRREELPGLLHRGATLIARGNGRSYGDAALNPELTLLMLAMDRIWAFDAGTGLLTCEAGVLLADLLETFVPRGWFPAVVPGTKFVTVGGMIAADVHGKNHSHDGTFGAHVESLTLATEDGEIRECSRTENAALFHATLGGMGLTGVILSACFRLRAIETAFVMEETFATGDLDETMALLEPSLDWPNNVAWIDGLARGAKLGRGVVMRGAFMERGALPPRLRSDPLRPAAPGGRVRLPVGALSVPLNRGSVGLFNELYYRRGRWRARGGPRPAHLDRFFFPLDRVEGWSDVYGRRGFVQYQCVLPRGECAAGLTALLERAAESGPGPSLAVLKPFGPAGEGLMSFPMEGYTLALNFSMRPGTPALLDEFDEVTHRHGGRVYLAKDACGAPERIREGYPHLGAFETVREEVADGSAPRFASELSRRLAL